MCLQYRVSSILLLGCGSTFADFLIQLATSQAGKKQEILAKKLSKEADEQVECIWAGMLIELEQ